MKYILPLLIFIQFNYYSQGPNIVWQKNFGCSANDRMGNIRNTTDGGFIFIATPEINDGDVHDLTPYMANAGSDFWVVKLNGAGNIIWKKCFGSSDYEYGYDVEQTSDGGYILIGQSSPQSEVTNPKGGSDVWIIKISGNGAKQWERAFGGSQFDYGAEIREVPGGYVFLAYSSSSDGDISITNNLNAQVWFVKIDYAGNLIWQKPLAEGVHIIHPHFQTTSDNGFIVAGTFSATSSVGCNTGNGDGFMIRLDSEGNIKWRKCLGSSGHEGINDIKETSDRGFIMCGETNSADIHGGPLYQLDCWVVKTDSLGIIIWQKTFGGVFNDVANSIVETPDGGFTFIGTVTSNDGHVSGKHPPSGVEDCWLVKINSSGNILQQACYGGSGRDRFNTDHYNELYNPGRLLLINNGYLFMATSNSADNGISNYGYNDIWLVRILDPTVNVITSNADPSPFVVYPNPTEDNFVFNSDNTGFVEIRNCLGVSVYTKVVNGGQSDISLPPGVYVLTFSCNEQTYKQIILKK